MIIHQLSESQCFTITRLLYALQEIEIENDENTRESENGRIYRESYINSGSQYNLIELIANMTIVISLVFGVPRNII